jgi:hypothetical protein
MLARSLYAESLKYRRTPALLLALGGPFAVGVLSMLAFVLGSAGQAPTVRHWGLLLGNLFNLWSLLMLPMGATLVSALAFGAEYAENHLKQVLSLPPPRWTVYAAKLVAGLSLTLIASLVMGAVSLGVGFLLGFPGPVPWLTAFKLPLLAFVAAWPVIALTVWISSRWKSFAVPLSVGVFGTFAALMSFRSRLYWPYVVWAYPGRVTGAVLSEFTDPGLVLWIALIVGCALMVLGIADFSRRDVT